MDKEDTNARRSTAWLLTGACLVVVSPFIVLAVILALVPHHTGLAFNIRSAARDIAWKTAFEALAFEALSNPAIEVSK